MLGLSLEQTRIYQEAKAEGPKEGPKEGREEREAEMLKVTVPLLLKMEMSVEQIAQQLNVDVEAVREASAEHVEVSARLRRLQQSYGYPMNEKTLIDTKDANRLMRSLSGSGSVCVQARAEFAQYPSNEYLPDLHLILDDRCQQPKVMFSSIHLLELFEVSEQLRAFIQVVPRLVVRAAFVRQ